MADEQPSATATAVLVVDDIEENRDLLARRLKQLGHVCDFAENGAQAIERMREKTFDLVLLDIMMPEMNGFEVLEAVRADAALRSRQGPIIVISALTDMESIVKCVELGAEGYLFKPFNPVLLRATVGACLERKHLRDAEQRAMDQLKLEQQRSENLLLSILPRPIAERLKEGNRTIADLHADVTILFADLNDFSRLTSGMPPAGVVELLNRIFSRFDALATECGVEKIKTIGDAYMAVAGVPQPREDHPAAVAELALAMQREIGSLGDDAPEPFSLRIGIHTGPVVAGVVGTSKFAFDMWGPTVHLASEMESCGVPGGIQVSQATYERLKSRYMFEPRGEFYVKGLGEVATYLLRGKQ